MNTIVLLTTRVAIMMGYRWHYFPKDWIIFKIDPIALTMFSCRGVFLVLISSLIELTVRNPTLTGEQPWAPLFCPACKKLVSIWFRRSDAHWLKGITPGR